MTQNCYEITIDFAFFKTKQTHYNLGNPVKFLDQTVFKRVKYKIYSTIWYLRWTNSRPVTSIKSESLLRQEKMLFSAAVEGAKAECSPDGREVVCLSDAFVLMPQGGKTNAKCGHYTQSCRCHWFINLYDNNNVYNIPAIYLAAFKKKFHQWTTTKTKSMFTFPVKEKAQKIGLDWNDGLNRVANWT